MSYTSVVYSMRAALLQVPVFCVQTFGSWCWYKVLSFRFLLCSSEYFSSPFKPLVNLYGNLYAVSPPALPGCYSMHALIHVRSPEESILFTFLTSQQPSLSLMNGQINECRGGKRAATAEPIASQFSPPGLLFLFFS